MITKPVIICDIDGTAAKRNGRSPYDYTKVDTDLPNEPLRTIIYVLHKFGYGIVYVSGREDTDKCRRDTEKWLVKHSFPRGKLYMRAEGDRREDSIVKTEIYNRDILANYANILVVFDDRNRVVKKWRELGLACFQVEEGDF